MQLFLSGLSSLFFPIVCNLLKAVAYTPADGRLMSVRLSFHSSLSPVPFLQVFLDNAAQHNPQVQTKLPQKVESPEAPCGNFDGEWVWTTAFFPSEGKEVQDRSQVKCCSQKIQWRLGLRWGNKEGEVCPYLKQELLLLKARSEITRNIIDDVA